MVALRGMDSPDYSLSVKLLGLEVASCQSSQHHFHSYCSSNLPSHLPLSHCPLFRPYRLPYPLHRSKSPLEKPRHRQGSPIGIVRLITPGEIITVYHTIIQELVENSTDAIANSTHVDVHLFTRFESSKTTVPTSWHIT